jgi:hypothetical protein
MHIYVSANPGLTRSHLLGIGNFSVMQIELRPEKASIGDGYAVLYERRGSKSGISKVEFYGERFRRVAKIF